MKKLWLMLLALLGCAGTREPLTQVDAHVYRSGQPTTIVDWDAIVAAKITDIVKLNFPEEGDTATEAKKRGIIVHELGIEPRGDQDIFDDALNTFKRPDSTRLAQAQAILKTAGIPADGKVRRILVQCTHGEDRTSFVVGQYLVKSGQMNKDEAYADMLEHHFHPMLHGLNDTWEDWQP